MCRPDGKHWIALPLGASGTLMVYRESQIKAVGFDTFPKTTDDFLQDDEGVEGQGHAGRHGARQRDRRRPVVQLAGVGVRRQAGRREQQGRDRQPRDRARRSSTARSCTRRSSPARCRGSTRTTTRRSSTARSRSPTTASRSTTPRRTRPTRRSRRLAADINHSVFPIGPVGVPTESHLFFNQMIMKYTKYPKAAKAFLHVHDGTGAVRPVADRRAAATSRRRWPRTRRARSGRRTRRTRRTATRSRTTGRPATRASSATRRRAPRRTSSSSTWSPRRSAARRRRRKRWSARRSARSGTTRSDTRLCVRRSAAFEGRGGSTATGSSTRLTALAPTAGRFPLLPLTGTAESSSPSASMMLERLQNSRNALGLLFMLPAAVLLLAVPDVPARPRHLARLHRHQGRPCRRVDRLRELRVPVERQRGAARAVQHAVLHDDRVGAEVLPRACGSRCCSTATSASRRSFAPSSCCRTSCRRRCRRSRSGGSTTRSSRSSAGR